MLIYLYIGMSIGVQIAVQVPVFNYFEYKPRVELLYEIFVYFLAIAILFSTVAEPFFYSLEWCVCVPISSHPYQCLILSSFCFSFFLIAILMSGTF